MTRWLVSVTIWSTASLAIALTAATAAAQTLPVPPPPVAPSPAPARPVTTSQPASPVAAPPLAAASPIGSCVRKGSAQAPTAIGQTPLPWNHEFEIEGKLLDPPDVVHALFDSAMHHVSLSQTLAGDIVIPPELVIAANKLRYAVLALAPRETPSGPRVVLKVAPLPLVRKVNIDIKQSPFTTQLDDQVRRRMRIRTGSYLPYAEADRQCDLDDEQLRIAEYLHFEEGFFDATVEHSERMRGDGYEITIKVVLGGEYKTGQIRVASAAALTGIIDVSQVVKGFQHDDGILSFTTTRFTRARHLEDIQRVTRLFQKLGFPEVRVHTTFESNPQGAFDRRTRTVNFTVTVDPRRQIDVRFDGNDPDAVPEDQLREQLTFNAAGSSDEVEAANSARAIVTYLQSRGWFDAHVTWTREPYQNPTLDRIWFRIAQGAQLPVKRIEFAGQHAITADLNKVIGTTAEKFETDLFGGNTNATSTQLSADVGRIVDLYRRSGYRDVQVSVQVATTPDALGSAALGAGLAAAERGDGLYVRYSIVEGPLTTLSRVEVALRNDDAKLHGDLDRTTCNMVLRELAGLYGGKLTPERGDRCAASAAASDGKPLAFREDDAAQTRDELKDRLFSRARPRAEVDYTAEPDPTDRQRVIVRYTLANIEQLQIGKVVIRGNFRTRPSVILGELNLREGALLTQDALAEGARKLRNTALFDAVKVTMPDLENTTAGEVNAVVDVIERYDFLTEIDLETGYSSYNGLFAKITPTLKNLFGLGISFDTALTIGFDLAQYFSNGQTQLRQLSAEATLKFPQWLSRRVSPVEFETDLTAFHRNQDTPRFGPVTTDGITLALSRTWERKRTGNRDARAITTGLHYDFRLRERTIDVLRPVGADDDQPQVPISTRTGSVGATFEWEQRVDRNHVLSPLAAERGFRLEAQVSFASQYLGGQDTFLKLSTAGSQYWLLGDTIVLRGDLRFDQGIPLGGAVLLPEVERFFAGGDSTVRGYDDDRLATEIVRVGVPPFANLQQIRILPAGGNIRAMASLDAQLPIYRIPGFATLATAVFVDAGMIANQWTTVGVNDIRPAVGIALFRFVFPFGALTVERAIPLRPELGDDPRGRWHLSFAARSQF